jgi:hypothetical protein
MESPSSSTVTAAWLSFNFIPLLIAAFVWLVLDNWLVALLLVILYPLYIVFYGFFISLPLMVRLFRHPASLHKR